MYFSFSPIFPSPPLPFSSHSHFFFLLPFPYSPSPLFSLIFYSLFNFLYLPPSLPFSLPPFPLAILFPVLYPDIFFHYYLNVCCKIENTNLKGFGNEI